MSDPEWKYDDESGPPNAPPPPPDFNSQPVRNWRQEAADETAAAAARSVQPVVVADDTDYAVSMKRLSRYLIKEQVRGYGYGSDSSIDEEVENDNSYTDADTYRKLLAIPKNLFTQAQTIRASSKRRHKIARDAKKQLDTLASTESKSEQAPVRTAPVQSPQVLAEIAANKAKAAAEATARTAKSTASALQKKKDIDDLKLFRSGDLSKELESVKKQLAEAKSEIELLAASPLVIDLTQEVEKWKRVCLNVETTKQAEIDALTDQLDTIRSGSDFVSDGHTEHIRAETDKFKAVIAQLQTEKELKQVEIDTLKADLSTMNRLYNELVIEHTTLGRRAEGLKKTNEILRSEAEKEVVMPVGRKMARALQRDINQMKDVIANKDATIEEVRGVLNYVYNQYIRPREPEPVVNIGMLLLLLQLV